VITKLSLFRGENEAGRVVVPLFGAADAYFEKVAAPSLMPEVSTYIAGLVPVPTSQYVLVNALGASEYYGSNVNGDAFPEASLIHRPDDWAHNPVVDKVKAKTWAYGFPTFYDAHPFAHHRNKDPNLAFGEVELACWNPHMKRVELVTRLDHDKCHKFGGTGVWDRLKVGGYPDVSMGSKVPFDTCSICLDWDRYRDALNKYDPKTHQHPGQAVLEVHKVKPIRGVSITRKDYCDHCSKRMNQILPDGRKIFVYNDFPRFFDISFVFVGADRTAKTMLFIFSGGKQLKLRDLDESSAAPVEGEKTASAYSAFAAELVGKQAEEKASEISKERMPSNLAAKAVPLLTRAETDLPDSLLDGLSALPLLSTLSTLGGLGVVLRPREFQRLTLKGTGNGELADDLQEHGRVFPECSECAPLGLGPQHFLSALIPSLLPFLSMRSGLGPLIEQRVIILAGREPVDVVSDKPKAESTQKTASPYSSELLNKIGALYNGYRTSLMDFVPHTQELLEASRVVDTRLAKLAAASVEDVFTPLSAFYFKRAFLDEVGDSRSGVIQHRQ
jgi:hypothetical protein